MRVTKSIIVPQTGIGKPDYSREVSSGMSLPPEIEALNTLTQLSGYTNYIDITNWDFVWLCPAGVITTLPLGMPAGYVCTRRYGFLSSDYYSKDITVNISVDGKDITPYGIPLTHEIKFDYGNGFVKRDNVTLVINNESAEDIYLTYQGVGNLLTIDVYENFYKKLADRTVELLLKAGTWTP